MWPGVFAFVFAFISIIKFVRDRVLQYVSPDCCVSAYSKSTIDVSFDKLWKFTASFNMHTFLLWCKLKPLRNLRNLYETFNPSVGALQNDFKNRCKWAVKWLGSGSCKFELLSAVMESVLTVVNSAVAAVQKFPESRSWLQYACRDASKRERMFITGHGVALVS